MTPKEFATALEDIILSANEEFLARLLDIQDIIYNRVLVKIKDLEIDSAGMIRQSQANRAILNDVSTAFSQAIKQSGYLNEVETYLAVIPKLDQLAENYFMSVSDAFKPNRQFMASLQKNVIQSLETQLFNEGLESQIKRPLMDIISMNINSGGQFSGFLDQVRAYIKGNGDIDGKLLSYARTLTRDALFNYSRAVQQAVTNDLGLVWYFYTGGLIKTSRQFCIDRSDKFWHVSEIRQWAGMEWAGKRPDTTESSIFIYLGGYNCAHSLVPVSDVVVPDEDKNRVK